jgi:RNA polymerase sigma-70 factor, ECF subfamily
MGEERSPEEQADITNILRRWGGGEKSAFDELMPLVYRELHRIAHARLRGERADHSLESTELVHEAWLRLVDQTKADWRDRVHFYAVSSRVIRHILVDQARARLREKRGGGMTRLTLNENVAWGPARDVDVVALDDALRDLTRLDERQGKVVELRYFAGLDIEETAAALGVSVATVNRDWVTGRAWLMRQMGARPYAEDPAS